MKRSPQWDLLLLRGAIGLASLLSMPGLVRADHPSGPPVNRYGMPVLDAQGHRIKYDQGTLATMARRNGVSNAGPGDRRTRSIVTAPTPRPQPSPLPRPTPVPPPVGAGPFWQYATFGGSIGATNILIGPIAPNGTPEIIIGGNSGNAPYDESDFWQALRYNQIIGNYDQIFVSRLYTFDLNPGGIKRLGLAHVTSASNQQIVAMLDNGWIYLYDFATKAQVGFIDTGIYYGLQGLNLTDLDGDGFAELILTTYDDLYVFNGSGQLLWQVAGAGGYDVVAGRMDNGSSVKIAATNGKVVDAVTHAIVWNYTNGFGLRLKLAPFAGENYQQLVSASDWQFVYSYDVGRQLPRWSIQTPQDIDAIDVADVDNDGVPELIIGDGQWGVVHVYDLNTQALKWEVGNPGWSVTNLGIKDVDGDGVAEVLWGSRTPNALVVASTIAPHGIEWQSLDLVSPFLGPAIGDLDGDGQLELVICSQGSGLADSGRILVFDLATLTLRAMSPPVVDNYAFNGVNDLKLRDVQGNGRMDIVIASAYIYDGVIEIYRFDSDNTFTRIWTNATRPEGNPFTFVEVADLDNNGMRKVITGNNVAHTGSDGVYVYIYDYPSGVQSWRSVALASDFNAVTSLTVDDLNNDGSKEIAALVSTGDLYTFDGPSRELRNLRQATNGTLLSNRASAAGLVLGDTSGVGHFLQWSNDTYSETFTRQLATDCGPYGYPPCLTGLNVAPDNSLWTGTGTILNQRPAPSYEGVAWQSPEIGVNLGRFVATTVRNGQDCVFLSAQHAVMGLAVAPPPTPTPTPNPRGTPRPRPTPRQR